MGGTKRKGLCGATRMIGIYKEEFIQYLKENLGAVKIRAKNIVVPCPYCEFKKNKKHYHLYIALDAPIFHCWQAKCNQSGTISKLTNFIDGKDRSEQFVDKSLITRGQDKKLRNPLKEKVPLKIPELDTDKFKLKSMYLKYRLGYDIDINIVSKLVFDIKKFIEINNVQLDEKTKDLMDFIQSNFIGFVTDRDDLLILRNIDPKTSFRYLKVSLSEDEFIDYYKIQGRKFDSNRVILAEGIFDIFAEQIFDSINIKDSVKLYAATLSGSFSSLLKSLVFHEQIYRLDVIILSHMDVDMDAYKKLRKFNSHIIDNLTLCYNKTGKDFSTFPVNPEKIIIKEDSLYHARNR